MNNEKLVCCNCNQNYVELNRPLRNDWYSDWYVCDACRQYLVECWFTEPEITQNTFEFDEVVSGENILDVEDIENAIKEIEKNLKIKRSKKTTNKI